MLRESTNKQRHDQQRHNQQRHGGIWRSLVATLLTLMAGALLTCTNSYAEDSTVTVLAHASSGPLQCEIRRTDAGHSVGLTGTITSSTAVAGKFRFMVTKSGPSGSSNINQGNNFELTAGSQTDVGHVTINLEDNAKAVVELVATSNDGIECRAKAPLER
ncbi:curli-like amyloid fiber formation chaperone CsgH [Bradyrhizobium sp. SYSU BS000235]|uniref:curli-like amyloid fiber formation chaperone CsgH n=1 Tax=Bradyrhizobium sp. SYSU BS000235 TaxID=3411332 RepID=UPI003C737199